MKYEGHITIVAPTSEQSRKLIRAVGVSHSMHYSEIAGWDETGHGHNAFLTTHGDNAVSMQRDMQRTVEELWEHGFYVKRMKIEECILDDRFTN